MHKETVESANRAINSALNHVAQAIDTCYYPGRLPSEPTVRIVAFVLNEIERFKAGGGNSLKDALL